MSAWALVYEGFDPRAQGLREALCTLGNGYFCTRGAAPEVEADAVHYPGTYLAGGYDRLVTEVAGRPVENEDLVNLPNWLPLRLRPAGGTWLHPGAVEVLAWRQELDILLGLLRRTVRLRDPEGRVTRLEERRLVHMGEPHLAALELSYTAENWGGPVEVCSALDARVVNAGVARYRSLEGRHLEPLEARAPREGGLFLKVRTRQSDIRIAQAARTRVRMDGEVPPLSRSASEAPDHVAETFALSLEAGRPVTVEKVVAVFNSRDRAVSECGLAAREAVARAGDFDALLRDHAQAWKALWNRFDTTGEHEDPAVNENAGRALRLHVFHLLQTASVHTAESDAGVPARGWHGEAYRGHVFWDELFILPLLNLRIPEISRGLLMYRYRRLGQARVAAREAGLAGALYPWQSGSDGREETQAVHLNPRSGHWLPDHSRLQYHVNAAIAYNLWHYYQSTADRDFLAYRGAEMLLEIARLWASLATHDAADDRYHLRGVVGPDEYHEAYPGAPEPGLDDNTYTNVMAAWCLCRALEVLDHLADHRRGELREQLGLGREELQRWREISARLDVVFHADGIMSQFRGYETLRELDWAGYRARYGDIQRLDRILEAEGDSPNRYKLSKQADVLMLFYLLSAEELTALMRHMGHAFDPADIPRTVDYYLARTAHGSTLSALVHGWILARSDRERSWALFNRALMSDLADVQGGTTAEGIHLGAMAGTVDLVLRGYTGIGVVQDTLWLNPSLPRELKWLRMRVQYRGHTLGLEMDRARVRIASRSTVDGTVRVGYRDRVVTLGAGEVEEFVLGGGCD